MKKDDMSHIFELTSEINGQFYQTWKEDKAGGMLQVIEEAFFYDPSIDPLYVRECNQEYAKGLDAIFMALDQGEDVLDLTLGIGVYYNPEQDGLTKIKWLVLLKQYLSGNSDAFNHIQSVMNPYTKWKKLRKLQIKHG